MINKAQAILEHFLYVMPLLNDLVIGDVAVAVMKNMC